MLTARQVLRALGQNKVLLSLDLQFNRLGDEGGAMAAEALSSNDTALRVLDLRGSGGLTSLPDALGECAALEVLRLHGCSRLTSLPDALSRCVALQTLSLNKKCAIVKTLEFA